MASDATIDTYEYQPGTLPLLLSFPHTGTLVADEMKSQFTPEALRLPDTDWFVDQLYDFAVINSLSRIKSRFSRYVIDLNRSPDDENLYPGQPTPRLCPIHCFDGQPIYRAQTPAPPEIANRLETYWKPYHRQIQTTLADFKQRFGFAMLLDVHSIASQIPRLFAGPLDDFNFGTNNERSCGKGLNRRIKDFAQEIPNYSAVVNGRFVGGYITRHYGNSKNNIHCVQIELSQSTYLDETTLDFDHEKAARVRPVIERFVLCLIDWIKK